MANRLPSTQRVTRSAARAANLQTTDSYRQECRRNRANRLNHLRNMRAINTSNRAAQRRAARRAILDERRRCNNNPDSSSAIIRDHYARMRSPRHPTPFHQSPVFKGIRPFNSPIDEELVTTFAYNDLEDLRNYVCPHCGSMLWKEGQNASVVALTANMLFTNKKTFLSMYGTCTARQSSAATNASTTLSLASLLLRLVASEIKPGRSQVVLPC